MFVRTREFHGKEEKAAFLLGGETVYLGVGLSNTQASKQAGTLFMKGASIYPNQKGEKSPETHSHERITCRSRPRKEAIFGRL